MTSTLKVFLFFSTLLAVANADSCTDCTAVVSTIAARLMSEESLAEQGVVVWSSNKSNFHFSPDYSGRWTLPRRRGCGPVRSQPSPILENDCCASLARLLGPLCELDIRTNVDNWCCELILHPGRVDVGAPTSVPLPKTLQWPVTTARVEYMQA